MPTILSYNVFHHNYTSPLVLTLRLKSKMHFCSLLWIHNHRWPNKWQWALHLCSSRGRGQVPQRRCDVQLVQLQQPAFPSVSAAVQPLRCDAVGTQPSPRRLQEQPLPQPPAARPARAHGGVFSRPARVKVEKKGFMVY